MIDKKAVFLLPLILVLGLAGCASDEDGAQPAMDTEPATEVAPEPDAAVPEPATEAAPEAEAAAPAPPTADEAPDEADEKYDEAMQAFASSETVAPFFEDAFGYAIFPTIGKGGFVVGGAHGKGRVYVDDEIAGTASVTQVSVGLQAGGQAFSEIIFFEDQRAYDDFTSGNFEFDAQASAVAIKAGAGAQVSTVGKTAGASGGEDAGSQAHTDYRKGMAIFTYSKGGLMAGASVGGQKFSFTPL